MSEPILRRTDEGPVAVLELNRPERRNAISRALMAELEEQIRRIEHDPKIRVMVLTGAPPVFCAGMDLKEAAREREAGGSEAEQLAVVTLRQYADLLQQIHKLPKPTVAALNGDALAGGAGLVSACDFAVAAEHARIGYPEVFRGLVPAIVMNDLVRLVGDRRARQLLIAGEMIVASTAHQWGLLNQVTTPERCLPEAIRVGQELTRTGPRAVAEIKRLLDEIEMRPANLRGVAAVSAAIRVGDEAQEGILAFLEKREPRWVEPG
jgi:methylglutaconyl-CoA hydratase